MPDADNLTTIETTLRDVLSMLAAERTGAVASVHGWPQPTLEQGREMMRTIVRALTHLVVGMRNPVALPPSQQELNEVIEGVALGVLEKVMGLPTPGTVH